MGDVLGEQHRAEGSYERLSSGWVASGSATVRILDAVGEAPLYCPRGGLGRGCSDSLYMGHLESPV